MPIENASICGCGAPLEIPASRNRTAGFNTIRAPKCSKNSNADDRGSKKHERGHERQYLAPHDTGSSSSMSEQGRLGKSDVEPKKRSNVSRRARSAERSESHYTYIDADSSVTGNRIRDNTIEETFYTTIPSLPESSSNLPANYNILEVSPQNSKPMYSVPTMTSPPPTYDVAISKSWQNGLPPSYEDYLYHKYATISRSHTPPPPWSDSSFEPISVQSDRRKTTENRQESREHLLRFPLTTSDRQNIHPQTDILQNAVNVSNSNTIFSKHVKQQRLRAMNRRSLSESRAHQQRLATMCEDGAFCMETTVIQSAFENGVAFCTLM